MQTPHPNNFFFKSNQEDLLHPNKLARGFLAINRQPLELELSSSSRWRFMAKKGRVNLKG